MPFASLVPCASVTLFSGSGSSSQSAPSVYQWVVVAHVLAQRQSPVAVSEHVPRPVDRQRTDRLDREPPREAPRLVGLVELLRGDLGRRRLVHPQLVGEAPGDLRRALHHHTAADLIVIVGQPVREAAAGRVQQQPRGLDRIARDRHGVGLLEALIAVFADVVDAGDPPGAVVCRDPRDHAVGADLGAVLDRIGDVGDQRRGLRVHLAGLQAEPAVDAVRSVAEAAVGDPDRADADLDPELASTLPRKLRAAGDRMRAVRIAVWISPRLVLAGDGQLELEPLVVALQLRIGDRPVFGDPSLVRTSKSDG